MVEFGSKSSFNLLHTGKYSNSVNEQRPYKTGRFGWKGRPNRGSIWARLVPNFQH